MYLISIPALAAPHLGATKLRALSSLAVHSVVQLSLWANNARTGYQQIFQYHSWSTTWLEHARVQPACMSRAHCRAPLVPDFETRPYPSGGLWSPAVKLVLIYET